MKSSRPAASDYPVDDLEFPSAVVASVACVVRNLAGTRFPDATPPADRVRLRDEMFVKFASLPAFSRWKGVDFDALPPDERARYVERFLATPNLARRDGGAGILVAPASRSAPDETLAVLLNDENHLAFFSSRPGFSLAAAYRPAAELERSLDGAPFEFAYDSEFGYLSSSPSSLGTGLHLGCLLHLPALRLTYGIEPSLRALERLGLNGVGFRYARGEDADSHENLYDLWLVSNAQTLGETEQHILARTIWVIRELVRREEWARVRIERDHPALLSDLFRRALATARDSVLVTPEEGLSLYQTLAYGLSAKYILKKGRTTKPLAALRETLPPFPFRFVDPSGTDTKEAKAKTTDAPPPMDAPTADAFDRAARFRAYAEYLSANESFI